MAFYGRTIRGHPPQPVWSLPQGFGLIKKLFLSAYLSDSLFNPNGADCK
jgi:hypothetical protein